MNIQTTSPHAPVARGLRLAAMLLGALLLIGCGQKGALYVPPADRADTPGSATGG